jgi:hypothetical protein
VNRSVSCRLAAIAVAAALWAGCGSDTGSLSTSPDLVPESTTSQAPPSSTESVTATTPLTTPAATATTTTSAKTPPATVTATTITTPAAASPAQCDEASVATAIGDDVAVIVDLDCDQGWAAAYWTDTAGLSRPAILKDEGNGWVLQDAMTVCSGDPMVPGDVQVPESLRRAGCPGG